jgi:hypothetical protein
MEWHDAALGAQGKELGNSVIVIAGRRRSIVPRPGRLARKWSSGGGRAGRPFDAAFAGVRLWVLPYGRIAPITPSPRLSL